MPKEKQPTSDANGSSAVERRTFKIETRADNADGQMTIGGYGAIFDSYTNMGWYAEVIVPGFFDGIKDDRCACLFNHEPSQVLGRKKNNTLTYTIDEKGIDYQSVMPAHRSDVYELIKGGYIYESSFAFTTSLTKWAEVDRSLMVGKMSESDLDALSYGGKISVRYLEKGKELFDLSPVTYGAYEGTTTDTRIAKRSFDAWKAKAVEPGDEPDEEPPPQRSQKDIHRSRLIETLERSK